jgi:hypothetical protein
VPPYAFAVDLAKGYSSRKALRLCYGPDGRRPSQGRRWCAFPSTGPGGMSRSASSGGEPNLKGDVKGQEPSPGKTMHKLGGPLEWLFGLQSSGGLIVD